MRISFNDTINLQFIQQDSFRYTAAQKHLTAATEFEGYIEIRLAIVNLQLKLDREKIQLSVYFKLIFSSHATYAVVALDETGNLSQRMKRKPS